MASRPIVHWLAVMTCFVRHHGANGGEAKRGYTDRESARNSRDGLLTIGAA